MRSKKRLPSCEIYHVHATCNKFSFARGYRKVDRVFKNGGNENLSEIEIDLLADIAKALTKIVQRLEDINVTLEALVPEQEGKTK